VEAVVLTRDPDKFRRQLPSLASAPEVALWRGDVRFFDPPPGHFDHVIHAATDTSRAAAADPYRLLDTIVEGTRRVLNFAVDTQAESMLLVSSGAVYGTQPPSLSQVPEDYPGAPFPGDAGSTYGQGKRMAEHLATLAYTQNRLKVKIARGFAFVGPGLPLDTHFAIGNFIRDALYRDSVFIAGDGTARRSYLYAADLAVWLWTILRHGTPNRPYNVGADQDLSIVGLAEQVVEVLAPGKRIRRAAIPREDGVCSVYVPSIERARRELGLEAWTDLPTALRRTADWARTAQPQPVGRPA
jgi:dTDP-glucose 4,6-dehydratase